MAALLQHARDYATDSLTWAVSEAQRCFDAPLDHTKPGPIEPLPELVNAPTGNPYFDRMLKSDTGLKFLELTDSNRNVKKSEGNVKQSEASPGPKNALTSPCLTVVIVDDEGNRKPHVMKINPSDFAGNKEPKEAPSDDSRPLDESLSKRSQPGAVKAAVQSLMEGCQCKDAPEGVPSTTVLEGLVAPQTNEANEANCECDCHPASTVGSEPRRDGEGKQNTIKPPLTNILAGLALEPEVKANIADAQQQPIDVEDRDSWKVGSVLEVFSASNKSWFPALVTQVSQTKLSKEMLTAQFWLNNEDAKQKTLARDSELLAKLGAHCAEQLPPGFQVAASNSRPGMNVFLDATTGLKYESLELIWAVHFKRWLEHPTPAGMQTISSVPVAMVSATTAPVEWSGDGEDLGLMTRVAPELGRDQDPPLEAEPTSSASAMYLEAGFEDLTYGDLDGWASWAAAAEEKALNASVEAPEALPNVDQEAAELTKGTDDLEQPVQRENEPAEDSAEPTPATESVEESAQSSLEADEAAKLGMRLVTSQRTVDSCNLNDDAPQQEELSARLPTSSAAMEKRLLQSTDL
mmetsp:Transcript_2497/g.4003  ORF Transcript_2497/g.4003 Transcript_2497/m.4003 type:complete len:577 (-) Transcript_2497:150-1880(-)